MVANISISAFTYQITADVRTPVSEPLVSSPTYLWAGQRGLSAVRHVKVSPERGGQRIDNFLLHELRGVPRTHVYRLLRRGEVRINGGRARPAHRLQSGDEVRIPPVQTGKGRVAAPSSQVLQRLQASIVYEDRRLIAIDKPSGLAVHGGSGLGYGVIEAFRMLRPNVEFLDLAHRLDRPTSGLLLLAKRRSTLRELHEMWRGGAIEKYYEVLLAGSLSRTQRVSKPLARTTGARDQASMQVVEKGGKASSTRFVPSRQYGGWTLAEARLQTGRMHQVRVHAASIGLPVAGDERYGGAEVNTSARQAGLRRLFLHASRLVVPGGDSVAALELRAPLPSALQQVLDGLPQPAADMGNTNRGGRNGSDE